MSEHDTVDLMARWNSGDQSAADELFSRYAARLINLVRHNLHAKFAGRCKPSFGWGTLLTNDFRGLGLDGSDPAERVGGEIEGPKPGRNPEGAVLHRDSA